MPDREKVIKGLEHCTSFDDGRDKFGGVGKCGGCPYYGHDCTDRMKKDVLAMLKEQEAKSVKEQIWCDNKTRKEIKGICPWCNSVITHHSYGRFCDKCGKPVIWGRSVKNMKAIIKLDVPEWQIGTEVSVYFKDTMMKRGICEKETKNIKLKQPKKCKDCVSCHTHSTGNSYCGMATSENPEMNITTIYIKDPNSCPDWCPIVKLNKSLEEMPQDKRDQFNALAKGLATLFGSEQGFEEDE